MGIDCEEEGEGQLHFFKSRLASIILNIFEQGSQLRDCSLVN